MRKHWFIILAICLVAFGAWADKTESEPNDDRFSADGPITFNETLTGGLPGSYGGDSGFPQDYWSFTGIAGNSYTFTATPQNSSFIAPLDLAIDLENSSGSIIASRDVNGDHQPETLNWACTANGTYYLVIYEATGIPNAIAWYTCSCQTLSSVDEWTLY